MKKTDKITKEKSEVLQSPYVQDTLQNGPIVSDEELTAIVGMDVFNAEQRVALLLQARPDLTTFFLEGMKAMVAEYKAHPKEKNPFESFFFYSCIGFVDTVIDRSIKAIKKDVPRFNSVWGIGTILKNKKTNEYRMIVNMIPNKTKTAVDVVWYNPTFSVGRAETCTFKTLVKWAFDL